MPAYPYPCGTLPRVTWKTGHFCISQLHKSMQIGSSLSNSQFSHHPIPHRCHCSQNIIAVLLNPPGAPHIPSVALLQPTLQISVHLRHFPRHFLHTAHHHMMKRSFILHMFLASVSKLRIMGSGKRIRQIVEHSSGSKPPQQTAAAGLLHKPINLTLSAPKTVPSGKILHIGP